MAKTSLVERMEKKGAPKTWIAEVKQLQSRLDNAKDKHEEYGQIIDTLVIQLQAEGFAFDEFEALDE